MKKCLIPLFVLVVISAIAGVVQSAWTVTGNQQTALNAILGGITTKGTFAICDGTNWIRLAPPANGTVLQFDSTTATGVKGGSVASAIFFNPNQLETNALGQVEIRSQALVTNLQARGALTVTGGLHMDRGPFVWGQPYVTSPSDTEITVTSTNTSVICTGAMSQINLPDPIEDDGEINRGFVVLITFQVASGEVQFLANGSGVIDKTIGGASASDPASILLMSDGLQWRVLQEQGLADL